MTPQGLFQIVIFFLILVAVTKPVGIFMTRVFNGERTFLHPVLRWLEVLIYKMSGIREDVEQRWTQYSGALLSFSVFGFLLAYVLQRAQAYLPLNPQHFGTPNVTPDLAFNTAVSFVTNTNWQILQRRIDAQLPGPDDGSDGAQFHFGARPASPSPSPLVRGFARQQVKTIGNFWVDLTRSVIYMLLPLSLIGRAVFCARRA